MGFSLSRTRADVPDRADPPLFGITVCRVSEPDHARPSKGLPPLTQHVFARHGTRHDVLHRPAARGQRVEIKSGDSATASVQST